MSRKTYRCYVNGEGMTHTDMGKRKVWRTDAVPTHCCSLAMSYFVWEKSTKHNRYQGWSGYVSPGQVTFIDTPPAV